MNYRNLQDSEVPNKKVRWHLPTQATSTFKNLLLMSNISPPLELKKLRDIGYSSDMSDCPGNRAGHRRAGKTPTHPGYGDSASGV